MARRNAFARAVRRRGAIVAALTAVGVFGILLIQQFLTTLLGYGQAASLGGGGSFDAVLVVRGYLEQVGLSWLPFAAGVFLTLWQLAPITERLDLRHVVARALLAGAGGAVLAWIALVGGDLAGGVPIGRVPQVLLVEAFAALITLVLILPAVVLGGILSWGWQRRHPLRHELRGALDEV